MKRAAILLVLVFIVGCATQQPVVVHEPGEPYPVIVTKPCIEKTVIPPHKPLPIKKITADDDWFKVLEALIQSIIQLSYENEQLRQLIEPCTTGGSENPSP